MRERGKERGRRGCEEEGEKEGVREGRKDKYCSEKNRFSRNQPITSKFDKTNNLSVDSLRTCSFQNKCLYQKRR